MIAQSPAVCDRSRIGSRAPARLGAAVVRVEALAQVPAPVDARLRRPARSRPPRRGPGRRRRSTCRASGGRTRSATGCAGPYIQISGRACRPVRRTDCRPGSCTGAEPLGVGIDAQDLAEQRVGVLPVAAACRRRRRRRRRRCRACCRGRSRGRRRCGSGTCGAGSCSSWRAGRRRSRRCPFIVYSTMWMSPVASV